MSQPRHRKGASGDGAGRGRGSAPRAPAPAAIPNTSRPREQSQRSRSKNNVPKSVRYDLDNALVGLCDVWFEEIKPHLVRNKIKLHVHEGGAGAASGDHAPTNAGCSHLDPGAASDRPPRRGASSAGCCSTRPTASKAQCLRPQAPSCNRLLPPSSALETQNHLYNYDNQSPKNPRTRRRIQTAQELSPLSRQRASHLCRTNSIVASPRPAPWNAAINTPYQEPCLSATVPYDDCYFQLAISRIKAKTQTKATQTDLPPKRCHVSVGCQSSPSLLNLRRVRRLTPSMRRSRPMSPLQLESSIRRECSFRRSPSPVRMSLRNCNRTHSKPDSQASPVPCHTKSQYTKKRCDSVYSIRPVMIPESDVEATETHANEVPEVPEVPEGKPCSTESSRIPMMSGQRTVGFGRTPATTTFFPSRRKSERRQPTVPSPEPVLFQDDLVNIIGDKHDKRLRVLFKKPETSESPSSMNLLPTPRDGDQPVGDLVKPPWK